MVLTACFALSRVTGLSCHPRRRKLLSADLTPASGRQDHTTSPSAAGIARQARRPRPPHPAPTSVTLRNAPPSGAGPNRYSADLGSRSRKILKIRNRSLATENQSGGVYPLRPGSRGNPRDIPICPPKGRGI